MNKNVNNMQVEIWKDIPNYEGIYQVSNLGNVKSLSRLIKRKGIILSKERILKYSIDKGGYVCFKLCKDTKEKIFKAHQLVAMAFLNHTPCGHTRVVDHINDNKLDNRLENLQVVTARYNAFKTQGKYSSQYKGVSWHKPTNKWVVNVRINSKNLYLGLFEDEHEAYLCYQNKLKEINESY